MPTATPRRAPTPPRRSLREAATAYHEAGHAVAAYFLHVPFRKAGATIMPAGNAGCVYAGHIFQQGHRPDENSSDAVRLRCESEAMVFLAGTEAQRKFHKLSIRNHHGESDFHSAVKLMSYFFFDPPVLEAYLKFVTAWAHSFFEHHPYAWRCVEAVAAALAEKRHLSGAELTEVIESAIGQSD
jgi:hypothetical protein